MNNNSVLLIGDKNKFLPSLTYLPQSKIEILLFYLIYFCIWGFIIYSLGTKNIKLKLLGFLIGAILLIILDYINNVSNEIFIDKNNDSLVSLSIDNKLPISYLGLPDLEISIPMISNKSLLLFDLKNYRHSNNEIDDDELQGRLSLVFYNK